jgi:hypothetical protein
VICSAERVADIRTVMPMTIRPLLVLTDEAHSEERDFYDIVPLGERLLVFGAVRTAGKNPMLPPEVMAPEVRTTTVAGRTIPGMLWSAAIRGKPGHEPRKTTFGSGNSSLMPMNSACGFAFIPWTGFRTAIWSTTAGTRGTTLGPATRLPGAGWRLSRQVWILSLLTSTRMLPPW